MTMRGIFLAMVLGMVLVSCDSDDDPGFQGVDDPIDIDLPEAPNILLVIADDMGVDATSNYPDYGVNKPTTPTLDSLSIAGITFDNFWVNPECAPTRSTILTGKYGYHTGVLSATGPKVGLGETSLQEFIADNSPHDYAMALVGKWHLADANNGNINSPNLMGIPHFYGYAGGAMTDYYNWTAVQNGESIDISEYATSVFTDQAINWINDQSTPWFMWLAHTTPHSPLHLPPADLHSFDNLSGTEGDIADNPRDYYFAMIEAMDSELNRLLHSIDLTNTIVIFMGDNGTARNVIQAPFNRNKAKSSLYQGGVLAPLIISGAGKTKTREPALINGTDLFATIANLTGSTVTRINNSHSIAPLLYGGMATRTHAYSEIDSENGTNGWTIRDEQYKLIQYDDGTEELYDLIADPYETTDLMISPTDASTSAYNSLINALPLVRE